jgi:hypothetical protein
VGHAGVTSDIEKEMAAQTCTVASQLDPQGFQNESGLLSDGVY